MRTDEIKIEIDEIKKWEDKIKRKDFKYEAGKCKYDSQQYGTLKLFVESIYSCKISIHEVGMDQTNLLVILLKIKNEILLIG